MTKKLIPTERMRDQLMMQSKAKGGLACMADGGSVDDDYRSSHTAPSVEFGAPMHDVTRDIYPKDFYGPNGFRYYADFGEHHDREAYNKVIRVKGKPDEMVYIHRAIPTSVYKEALKKDAPLRHMIRKGDWVAISKQYAKDHGESVLNGDYKIASMRVPAKHVWTNGDSIHEWGYCPVETKAKGGSVIKQLEDYLRERKGEYGVKRLQRAADEIPGLESMYKLDALRRAFGGDNAKALMSMNPADFEKFAIPLESHVRASSMTQPEYIKHLAQLKGGFADVPFLEIGREYPKALLNIQGHEGRHRSRALAGKNVKKSLVNLFPTASMRESMPRRSQEEFIEAMKKELGKERFVSPEGTGTLPRDLSDPVHKKIEERGILEVNRPQLPDIYAKGGNVDRMRDHMMVRGLAVGGQGPKNWLKGSVEQVVNPLLPHGPKHRDEALMLGGNWARDADTPEGQRQMAHNEAITNWIQSNLTNYIKKQMATHNDPVRKLAEQGIVHIPSEQVGRNRFKANTHRATYGAEQLGKSEIGREHV